MEIGKCCHQNQLFPRSPAHPCSQELGNEVAIRVKQKSHPQENPRLQEGMHCVLCYSGRVGLRAPWGWRGGQDSCCPTHSCTPLPTSLPSLALVLVSLYASRGLALSPAVLGVDPKSRSSCHRHCRRDRKGNLCPSPRCPASRWLSRHLGGEEGRMRLFREFS